MIRNALTLAGLGLAFGMVTIGAASAQDAVAAAQANLDKYTVIPTFTAAGEPFDAKTCMAGKSIMSIPGSSAVPFLQTINASMAEIAKTVGFEFKIWENQGQPTQWAQGLDYGAANKVSLIDLLAGADPRSLVPQIKAARDAGAIVTASHVSGFGQDVPGGVSAVIPIAYKEAGALLADWTIAKTGGKTNALVLVTNEVLSTDSMVAGLTEAFAKCPDCKFTTVNMSIPDWASKIQPTVQSAVIADPTLNYIIPIYDGMNQFVVPALQITGAADHVKIATFNGTPFVLDMIQNGQVEMDLGENLDWIAYGLLDAQMRILCGLPEVTDPKIPLLIFDADNAATAGTPAEASKGYGDAYLAGYKDLWKL
ncbi:MAG: sugar transporter periplasmatic substrate-binding protein [Devosia sp.]|uniref:sugar ABC transporter substrate-binding protein n=1 Tax=Devosia sp. TaxID=1871048 RepID=UPI00262E6AE9|nr:sugar ABC transporter substrate-binding protein [Devosia sp.]MDB5529554.1 sugar transporter periplasmatic substrate-binding protein [Devosia sp.]